MCLKSLIFYIIIFINTIDLALPYMSNTIIYIAA